MERTALHRALDRWELLVFVALLLAHLLVVWRMPVFLTQDGPSHLYNARILLELWARDPSGLYSDFFTLNTSFSPNWTGNIILAGLLKFFTPVVAEKMLVSIHMIVLPLAFRYAVRSLKPGPPILASLIFLLTYNFHLVYGFFNFCLGLAVLFWFIGAYHKFRNGPSVKRGVACAFILLLMLATHPVALLVGFLFTASDATVNLIALWRKAPTERSAFFRRVAQDAAIVGPALLLFLLFLPTSTVDQPPLFQNKWSVEALQALLHMDHLVLFNGNEVALFRSMALLLAILFVAALWKNRSTGLTSVGAPLILLLACCVAIHFFVSDQLAGGAYLTSRIALIAWMVFALYIATRTIPTRAIAVGVGGTVVLSASLLFMRYPAHARCGEQAAAYISSCGSIPDGSTFLPLCFSDQGEFGNVVLSPRIKLFKHMSGYVAAERRLISLDNYEANTAYFQTAWLPSVNPFKQLCADGDCDIEGEPTSADLTGFEKRTQRRIDHVVLWGDLSRAAQDPRYSAFKQQLDEWGTTTFAEDGPSQMFRIINKRPAGN
ncbi:MAG: hypothetical protein IPI55_08815 [Flavobacteriales bacterium]|nr:hypothetical protein [Flavobacteriales bacterium]